MQQTLFQGRSTADRSYLGGVCPSVLGLQSKLRLQMPRQVDDRSTKEALMMIASSSFLDVVYAVVYSLLLLNTDLHVAQGNHHRMSKQEFIKNTMLAIHAQLRLQPEIVDSIHFNADMEKYLKVSVPLQTMMNINRQFFVCASVGNLHVGQELPNPPASV